GREFDLAINGDGFFTVQAGEDIQYTRDGRFTLDATGALVAADGAPVLDEAGAPVVLPPTTGEVVVSPSGAVMADGVEVGRIGVVGFENLSALRKAGEGRFAAPPDAIPFPMADADIRQGFHEGSNVNPVLEITRM